ncbi:MAG: hypothetical protein U5S82_00935 [Gammaproteobacteria bacterium]|nr:hypothetical protein [Gammaproteobacteria bacterium]
MKRSLLVVLFWLPLAAWSGEFESTLLVQTGKLRESDLIVRAIADLESNRVCLGFYIRTPGTSSSMACYDTDSGFRSRVDHVGYFQEGKLVIRKVRDHGNQITCLVAYASTPGTSPAIDCYKSTAKTNEPIRREDSLREGDLEIIRLGDPDSTRTCLVAFVKVGGAGPAMACYDSVPDGQGGIVQTSAMREGDLVVRKVVDQTNSKACLASYVSTTGTTPTLQCSEQDAPVVMPVAAPRPPAMKSDWPPPPEPEPWPPLPPAMEPWPPVGEQ